MDRETLETVFEKNGEMSFETERGSTLAPRAHHMRCPNCRKLYSVESSLLGETEMSKFECVSCHTTFLAMKPALNGPSFLETQLAPLGEQSAPLAEPEIDETFERAVRSTLVSVPLNDATVDRAARERAAQEIALSESAELVSMWTQVMADYPNEALHEAFLNKCFEEKRLTYATHKYAQILVSAPQEEIARKMRKRAQGLASYGFAATSGGLSRWSWKVPLPSFNNLILLLGTIAAVVGLGLPHAGHTAGLGFAMIALSLGLRFFLRRPANS